MAKIPEIDFEKYFNDKIKYLRAGAHALPMKIKQNDPKIKELVNYYSISYLEIITTPAEALNEKLQTVANSIIEKFIQACKQEKPAEISDIYIFNANKPEELKIGWVVYIMIK